MALIKSSLMPLNGYTIVRKRHKSNRSITVGKKQHTLKNTLIATIAKLILFVGRTVGGPQHYYTLLKAELPPTLDWFALLTVLVDLGYFGIQTDYSG